MIESNLSLLIVVVPLIAAPLLAILPPGRLPWAVTLVVSWAVLAMAGWQLWNVLDQGVISYELGGWAPPWGIEYRIDALNAFMTLVVAGIAALTLPYALRSAELEIPHRQLSLFYSAFALCLTGLLGISQTGDVFNVFVFLEISSLSSYVLISLGRDRRALTTAYQYLIMGTIGATFLLIGIGLIYAATGTLNMIDLAERIPAVSGQRTVHTALAFIVVGVALKLALFPLHHWLPNAYTYAPTVITVFLAATATKVAVYVMLRMLFTVFPENLLRDTPTGLIFVLLGVVGVLIASYQAIFQMDVKRMLAFSSVAQIGYMVLGIGFGTVLGVTAATVHLFNHAMMKGALFMAVGALAFRVGSSRFEDFAGLGRRMPWTFAAIVVGGLSLIGVPSTAGFISKWYLVSAAIEQQAWGSVAVILIGSLLAVIYVWKLVEVLYFKPAQPESVAAPGQAPGQIREAPLSLLLPTWALVLANVYFGLNTDLTVGVATRAVQMLGLGAT